MLSNSSAWIEAQEALAAAGVRARGVRAPPDAAVARHVWLPGNDITASYDPTHIYWLLLLVPALVHDTLRLGGLTGRTSWALP